MTARLAPLLPSLLLVACSTAGEAPSTPAWKVQTALVTGQALGGCAVGDLSAATPGNEIAAVGESGSVFLAHRADHEKAWEMSILAELPGEMIQCSTGDILADRPGEELLVFGMRSGTEDDGEGGAAYVLWEEDGAWQHTLVLEDSALIHGGCVADVDPDRPGNELVLAGYGRAAFVAWRTAEGWQSERAAELSGAGKNAIAFGEAGLGAAIGLDDGGLVHLTRADGAWSLTELDRAPAGQSRLAVAGSVLLSARDDGVLAWIQAGERTELLTEGQKLRGAALGDFDPSHPGIEVATGGYERRLSLLRGAPGDARAEVLFEDERPIHHVASGELDPDSPGEELAFCGHAGILRVLGIRP